MKSSQELKERYDGRINDCSILCQLIMWKWNYHNYVHHSNCGAIWGSAAQELWCSCSLYWINPTWVPTLTTSKIAWKSLRRLQSEVLLWSVLCYYCICQNCISLVLPLECGERVLHSISNVFNVLCEPLVYRRSEQRSLLICWQCMVSSAHT